MQISADSFEHAQHSRGSKETQLILTTVGLIVLIAGKVISKEGDSMKIDIVQEWRFSRLPAVPSSKGEKLLFLL